MMNVKETGTPRKVILTLVSTLVLMLFAAALPVLATTPTIYDVNSSLGDGTYATGQVVPITVTFSESVNVTDTPQLTLNTTPVGYAVYRSGGGTSILSFEYTVQTGDSSPGLNAVSLSGGIKCSEGNHDVTLTLPSAPNTLASHKAIVIDASAPVVTNVTTSRANATYKAGDIIPVSVVFNENVVVTNSPRITLNTGGTASYTVGSGTGTLTFDYTVQSGDTSSDLDVTSLDLNGGTIADNTGNSASIFAVSNLLSANKDIIVDGSAPLLTTSTVNGTSMVLTYNKSLNTTPPAAFVVTVDGSSRNVSNVAVSGTTVNLTLASAVTSGQMVMVSYTPGANPIRDLAGNNAGSLTNRNVTNSTGGDTTAPTLSTSTVNGASLVLTYNESLNTASVPAAIAFAVRVAGSARTVNTVAVSGVTVTLTLASAVTSGQTVNMDYTVPGSNQIKDLAGNNAALFTNRSVTNNTADTTAPSVSSASVNGSSLTITFNESLGTSSVSSASSFTVKVDGNTRTVNSVSISGSTVTLTLSSAVTSSQTVTVDYTVPGTNQIKDVAGNSAAGFTGRSVTNNTGLDTTAPTVSSAAVNGASLTITFNESLNSSYVPTTSAFTVKVGSDTRSISSVSVSGTTVTLTLASAVTGSQTVTVDYTAPSSYYLRDQAGNSVASFTGRSVTNNTGADTTVPSISSAVVNGASLVLTYSESLDTSSTPGISSFTVKVDGSTVIAMSVVISGKTVTLTLLNAVIAGQNVTVRYETPSSGHIQDLAGNHAASFSSWVGINETPVKGKTIVLKIGNKFMTVNGTNKEIDQGMNTVPVIEKGRTLLPIRAIIEALGGTVNWDAKTKKVTVVLKGKTIELWIGKTLTKVGGVNKTTDVAPKIIRGRTMLPLRFITENLGCGVNWDGTTRSVTITQ